MSADAAWPTLRLDELATIKRGASPRPIQSPRWFADSGHGWVRIGDVTRSDRVLTQTTQYLSEEGRRASVEIVPGDLIMSICATIGRPLVSGMDACIHDGFVVFRDIRLDRLDSEYLYYFLQEKTAHFDSLSQPGTQKNLNSKLVGATEIPLPPLDEQRRIAEVLRSTDQVITSAHATVEQAHRCLDMHLTALMQWGAQSFSMTPSDAGLPSGWKEGRCDAFLVLQRGFDITEKQASPGHYWVISSSGPAYLHNEAAVEGPVVITGRKGRLGTVFFSDSPCWPHDTTLWVKDFKGNCPRFIFWKLREMRLETYGAATSVPTLNRNNVHALTVRFPPLDEQQEIANILDAEWAMIEQEEAQVRAVKALKEALASDLLSGRVRVPA